MRQKKYTAAGQIRIIETFLAKKLPPLELSLCIMNFLASQNALTKGRTPPLAEQESTL